MLQPNGRVVLVKLLNDALLEHFRTSGLWVDYYRKRVHFKKPDDSRELKISYQARVRKATRTVVKERMKKSGEGVAYYEHKALSFHVIDFSTDWAILLSPGYTFTRDGFGLSIGRDRLNVLSTRRAAKDFNQAVHQDITFWISVISSEANGIFPLKCREEIEDFAPTILLSSRPPTVSYGADSFENDDLGWENDVDLAELEDEILSMISAEEGSGRDGSEMREGE